jgi:hypothetical protein
MNTSQPENREHDFKPNGFGSDHCLVCGGKVSEHTVDGREQTFESKLSVILTKLDKGEYLDEGDVYGCDCECLEKLA